MVIFGAGGHALEVISILKRDYVLPSHFYSEIPGDHILDLPAINDLSQVKEERCIIAVGNPGLRDRFYNLITKHSGIPLNVVSSFAITNENPVLSRVSGINIMDSAQISLNAQIGNGVLVNFGASVHHDAIVGDFCDIGPGARILGKVTLGNRCSVGANSVILPGLILPDNVVVGAGSVVTKSCPSGSTIAGVPARLLST